jgi:hypothetical protein
MFNDSCLIHRKKWHSQGLCHKKIDENGGRKHSQDVLTMKDSLCIGISYIMFARALDMLI